jgi:hypothetical protein
MSLRPRPTPPGTPDALRRPALDDALAPESVPTLREILARYRQQGTVPGRLAAAAPADEPAAAPRLASLRSLFLDSTGEPTLGAVSRDDAWLQPPPSRRR